MGTPQLLGCQIILYGATAYLFLLHTTQNMEEEHQHCDAN